MAITKREYPPSAKNPKGRTVYRVQLRTRGVSASETFERLSDARTFERAQLRNLDLGKHGALAAAHHGFARLVDRYITDAIPLKKEWAKQSQVTQLREWVQHIGDVRLSEVTQDRIELAISAMAAAQIQRTEGGKTTTRSAATLNRYLAALSHCFTKAIDWGMTDTNPCARIKRRSEPKERVRFLSEDERARLLAETEKNPALHVIVLCALSTGARDMNVRGWKWCDVDLERGTALAENTKNDRRQTLTIAGDALDALREWAKVRRIDSPFVFPSIDGKRPVEISSAWQRARKRAGLYSENAAVRFRFHDLRHTTASNLAAQGESLRTIGAVLNHKTAQMTMKYAHLTEQHQADAVRRMMESKRAKKPKA